MDNALLVTGMERATNLRVGHASNGWLTLKLSTTGLWRLVVPLVTGQGHFDTRQRRRNGADNDKWGAHQQPHTTTECGHTDNPPATTVTLPRDHKQWE